MANPFEAVEIKQSAAATLPTYREYAWDFENDHFMYTTTGEHKVVTENEALKVWVYKALKSERYRYRAYDNGYGCELEQFIGKANDKQNAMKIKRYIKDGLLVNPYIKSIDNIEVTAQENDDMEISLEITTVYGSFVTSVTVS